MSTGHADEQAFLPERCWSVHEPDQPGRDEQAQRDQGQPVRTLHVVRAVVWRSMRFLPVFRAPFRATPGPLSGRLCHSSDLRVSADILSTLDAFRECGLGVVYVPLRPPRCVEDGTPAEQRVILLPCPSRVLRMTFRAPSRPWSKLNADS